MAEEKDSGAESATIPEEKHEAKPEVNDLQQRIDHFNVDLKALLGKYELVLTAEARIVRGLVVGVPVVEDGRKKPAEKKAEEK